MPAYELMLIVKSMQRPEVASVVKRACEMIAQRGGFVRSMENIGHRQLPYKMSSHGDRHTTGHGCLVLDTGISGIAVQSRLKVIAFNFIDTEGYVLLNFDSPPRILDDLQDELHRDIDIIRPSVLKKEEPFERPCLIAPCVFGELPFPDHEKRTWRAKVHKQLGSSYKTVETRKKPSFEKNLL